MSNLGYAPKNLLFDEEGREKLYNGIAKISSAVKSTLGPEGQTVLIESNEHTRGMTVTKDGVTVAKAVSLLDPTENLAVNIMKEAADKTATQAGDGTTTAIVLTEALVNAGKDIDQNKTQILRELKEESNKIVESLKTKSTKVTNKKLKDVATISANNDTELGKIISDVYKSVGKDGLVAVDRSQSSETYFESTKGIKIDRGYESELFINDQKKDECVLEDAYVLVSDAPIENILNIENVLKPVIQDNKRLLIIAPVDKNVVNTLAANVMKNNLKICVIGPPSFGYKQHELMQDIAISLGATYFSEKTGDDLSLMTTEDLGHCAKLIVSRDSTVVIKDETENNDEIKQRVSELKVFQSNTNSKEEKEFISKRIASLTGGIGVIYVGGKTDLEQKELYDRVDDAVCAVKSALEEGILPGGGVALYKLAKELPDNTIAQKILKVALQAPLRQIWLNAGIDEDPTEIKERYADFSWGMNVKTQEFGDLYEMGIIDPLKVTRSALENAVSVAVTLLSTNAIITMARTYEDR
ncbi:MAG: chaperonin GroEL [Aliivibrio sp.]|nr:chaperonin GroEL [Aliivibrio sp.]